MPTYILKMSGEGRDFYLEWSTVVDAPITQGMSLDEFKAYYQKEYGDRGMRDLPERLERVERTGCSAMVESLDDVLSINYAGDDGETITKEEIFKKYCLDKSNE